MKTQERGALSTSLIATTVLGSVALAGVLLAVHIRSGSQLALAQAADSLADTLGAAALLWAVRASARPPDEEHPTGHARAESIAALIVAVLVGVLAVEVLRSAVAALAGSTPVKLDWPVAAVFAAKVGFKAVILGRASTLLRHRRNPVLVALRTDARNDLLVGALALLGFVLTRVGLPRLDSILAIGVALYIAVSGLQLGRENVSLLLGKSVSPEHQQQLASQARSVAGVIGIQDVVAIWHGPWLHVQLTATVDDSLRLREAHAIGHAVERRLLMELEVRQVSVHIEPAAKKSSTCS